MLLGSLLAESSVGMEAFPVKDSAVKAIALKVLVLK